jgi:hypothetical protein
MDELDDFEDELDDLEDELDDLGASAYHEAGHAVVARILGTPVQRVTINGRTGTLVRHGTVAATRALITFSGPLAEARHCGLTADDEARLWPDQWRGDLKNLLKHDGIDGMLAPLRQQAELLVARHWTSIERVASALLARGEVSGGEVDMLLDTPEFHAR